MRRTRLAPLLALVARCAQQQNPTADAQAPADLGESDPTGVKDTGIDVFSGPPRAPRALAPLSSSMVNTRRPVFRWSLGEGTDGAVIEVCRDRGCNDRLTRIAATGSNAQPDADLPPGVLFWRLLGRRGPLAGTEYSPTWQLSLATRTARATTAFGSVLDLNGDGHADLAASSPSGDSAQGTVSVFIAADTELPLLSTFTLRSPDPSARGFGLGLSSASDLDGDGFCDLAVGAPGEPRAIATGDAGVRDGAAVDASARDAGRLDAGDAGDSTQGAVYVFRGGVSGVATTPSATLSVPGAALFGAHVAAAGDVNGDGYGDLLVSAQGSELVFVFSGSAQGVSSARRTAIHGRGDSLFGSAVAGPGDVNGDGYADVLVGSPGEAVGRGAVFVYLGAGAGLQATPLTVAARDALNDRRFGASLAGAGDVNGDGYADVIFGAPGATGARGGRAYVYTGTPQGFTGGVVTALAPPDELNAAGFGAVVSSAGDVNSDGSNDVLVSAAYDPTMPASDTVGRVFVFLGTGLGVIPTAALTLEGPAGMGSRFGAAMALAGDVNGDAFGDVALSEPRGMESRGRVHVYFGGMMGLGETPGQTLEGRDPGGALGSSLAGW